MNKKRQIEKLKIFWNERNPQHELNSDSGENMFWETVLCIFNDLNQVNGDSTSTEALPIADVSSSNGCTRHSNCCNEEVTVIGEITKYYQCNYCKQPCDTEMLEDEKS